MNISNKKSRQNFNTSIWTRTLTSSEPAPEPIHEPTREPKREPEPKRKIPPLRLRKNVLNKVKDEEKNKNDEISATYFWYPNLSYFAEYVFKTKKVKKDSKK